MEELRKMQDGLDSDENEDNDVSALMLDLVNPNDIPGKKVEKSDLK